MGSDLHMSPPTPDEYRIVRGGSVTAVYSRHTDGIYREGTKTWFRKHYIDDPTEAALKSLKATQNWPVVAVSDGFEFPEEMDHLLLASPDREWDKEQHELEYKVQRTEEQVSRAWEGVVAAKVELQRFQDERKRSES